MLVTRGIAALLQGSTAPSGPPVLLSPSDPAAVMQLVQLPPIAFTDFVERLVQFMHCAEECFVIAVDYALRLADSGAVALTPLTIHRVFGTCVVIAVKYHEDEFPYSMAYYAQVVGVSLCELCLMERFVLKHLDFSAFVSEEQYKRNAASLSEVDLAGNSWLTHASMSSGCADTPPPAEIDT
jgi:hypothetical protein